jgi:hypothetical protein
MSTPSTRRLTPGLFAATLVCFILPFVDVSCQGERVVELSGVELATGKTVEQKGVFGEVRVKHVPASGWAIAAVACAVAGIASGVARTRVPAFAAPALGAAGAVLLVVLRSRVDADVVARGEGMLRAEWGGGYWLTLVLFLAAAVVGYATREAEDAHPRGAAGGGASPFSGAA